VFFGYMMASPGGGCHADPDALENRARPPFQAHPLQATWSLIASMLLAALVVLALVSSVR